MHQPFASQGKCSRDPDNLPLPTGRLIWCVTRQNWIPLVTPNNPDIPLQASPYLLPLFVPSEAVRNIESMVHASCILICCSVEVPRPCSGRDYQK
jgi:hypothetical protein